jgi:hypothetical protein
MPQLPPDFQFSQSSLQDYTDCDRRFELRYLLRQAWPALEVEPLLDKENYMKQGATFHRMVHQYLLGLEVVPRDEDLARWWEAFLAHGLDGLPAQRYPEKLLSINLGGVPLIAKYDLIAIEPGQRAVIADWKTAHQRPRRDWLERRLQTRIYRYLMVRSGAALNGGQPFAPEQVEMVYWFTNFPNQPERLVYDSAQFTEDEALLKRLIQRILAQGTFPLTDDVRRCKYCLYRTLCSRGDRPGHFSDYFLDVDADSDEPPILELEF